MNLRRIILVGHSLGGQIAAHVGNRLRERMLGLALIDIWAAPDPQSVAAAARDFGASLRVYSDTEAYTEWLMERRPLLTRAVAHWIASSALTACADGFELRADPALADVALRAAECQPEPDFATHYFLVAFISSTPTTG